MPEWVEANGLTLHPEKTCIVDEREPGGFDFLGYHFERGMKWPGKKSMGKLRDAVRAKTRRANGHSMARIIRPESRVRENRTHGSEGGETGNRSSLPLSKTDQDSESRGVGNLRGF